MMLIVILMFCACAAINAQYPINQPVVVYSTYSEPDCVASNNTRTSVYIQDVCSISGVKYNCTNNEPFSYYYPDNTCSGAISSTNSLVSTCTSPPSGGSDISSCASSYIIPINTGGFYFYDDITSCNANSLTNVEFYPLDTCISSTRYTCNNGIMSQTTYSDASCNTVTSTFTFLAGCQNGVSYKCYSAPAPAPTPTPTAMSYVIIQGYISSTCSGTATSTTAYVQNVCISGSNADSDKYTCTNNVPIDNYYNADPTCAGTTSSPNPLPTTCTSDNNGGFFVSSCATSTYSIPSNSVVIYDYSDETSCATSSLTSFTAYPLNVCLSLDSGSLQYFCSNSVPQFSIYNDAKCSSLNTTYVYAASICYGGTKFTCSSSLAPNTNSPKKSTKIGAIVGAVLGVLFAGLFLFLFYNFYYAKTINANAALNPANSSTSNEASNPMGHRIA